MTLKEFVENWVEDKPGRTKLALYDTEEGLIGVFTMFVFKKQIDEPNSEKIAKKEIYEWSVDWRRKAVIAYI